MSLYEVLSLKNVEGGGNNCHRREVSQNEALLTYVYDCGNIGDECTAAAAARIEIAGPMLAFRYDHVDGCVQQCIAGQMLAFRYDLVDDCVQQCSSLVVAGKWDSPKGSVPYYLDLIGVKVIGDVVFQSHGVHRMTRNSQKQKLDWIRWVSSG